MRIDLLTLHPAMFQGPLEHSIVGRGQEGGRLAIHVHDLRDWSENRHRQVDDTPAGGGSGMVIRVDVIDRAIQALTKRYSDTVSGVEQPFVVLLDPVGTPFRQKDAERLADLRWLLLVCGHYEGIDARVREHLVDAVVSIGDFVVTGGEIPAMLLVDAVARLLPGVLGNPASLDRESFTDGLLEAPQYTRPREYRGWSVPEVLFSGHHARIAAWREEQSRSLTAQVRPDLLDGPEGET